ncbi:MAG: NnrU family protein [Rhodobiaceae bacterium]|nr:NnrU family protein [Rhodobiaceae bacterium]MCC0056527.1 NnrU family protein [Rhodobiaceae bacterium]
MAYMIFGLILFLGVHIVPMAPDYRAGLLGRLGERGYRAGFSVVSVIGLVLIVYGYGLARSDSPVIYTPPEALRHLAMGLMIFVFILLVAAYVPGKIREKVRHPMIAAVKIWAFAHLLANGRLAEVVLFGAFLAWAVIDRVSLKRREAAGLVTVTGGPAQNDIVSLVLGVTLYVAFLLWLHRLLIGVPLL